MIFVQTFLFDNFGDTIIFGIVKQYVFIAPSKLIYYQIYKQNTLDDTILDSKFV